MCLLTKFKKIALSITFFLTTTILLSQPCTDGYGVNLGGIVSWTSDWYFVNIAHHSLHWFPPNQSPTWGNWYTENQLTADRYLPAGQSGILGVIWDSNKPINGNFVLTHSGTATVSIYNPSQNNTVVTSTQPGRIEFSMNGTYFLFVEVTANNPTEAINDLRITKAAEEQLTQTYSPQFIQEISHYKQLRFMDWAETNNSPIVSVSDYPTENALIQRIASLEKMIELSNLTNADPWFCIPLQADDALVTQWAQTIKSTLNPNLNVRIELSNEVWNGIFTQHAEAANLARQLGLQNTGNNWQDAPAYFGHRSAQIHEIFETEFASGGPAPNLVKVIAWQAANSWFVDNYVLPFYRGVCGTCVPDEMAIAPYFSGSLGSPTHESTVETWNLATLFDQIENGTFLNGEGSLQDSRDWINDYNNLIANEGIPALSLYEGGQHLSGNGGVENNQTIVDLFIAANQDNRMGDMYTIHLNDLKAAGVNSICMFASHGTYSKWGSWGLKEYVGQPDAQSPKHVAYRDFIQNNPFPPNCGSNCPQQGQPCDDNDNTTLNDQYDGACTCQGTTLLQYDASLRCTNAMITIDGVAEKAWSRTIQNTLEDPILSTNDLSADWAMMYDDNNLYLWFDVQDDQAFNDSGTNPFDDDAIELFIDPDYSQNSTYDGNDIQLVFRRGDPTYYSFQNGQPATFTGAVFNQVDNGSSYQMEIQIPWSALGQTGPFSEKFIGFAFKIDDDDDGLARDDRLFWNDLNDIGWSDPSAFGSVYTGKCSPIKLWAYLEGALVDPIDPRIFLPLMRTDLNTQLSVLPGQAGGVIPTPAGHPYQIAPWNHTGTEGADFLRDEYTLLANNYGNVPIVDWVLVGFRTGTAANTEVASHAALLQADGTILFLDDQVLMNLPVGNYYVQVEHRNHMGVLSATPVSLQGGELLYDFREADSWRGTLFGQKEVEAGRWALFSSDGDQLADSPGYDINGNDRILWETVNGQYNLYHPSDHNLNGDVNGADRILWDVNFGYSSTVER